MSQSNRHILRVDASMRRNGSHSRTLTDQVIDQLSAGRDDVTITTRDLADDNISFVNETWIGANFTDPDARSDDQKSVLAHSDALIEELKAADTLVIGVPIYNFGVPAALKAWIDMIARARVTFRYTPDGPKGLLENKKAILVMASGGTPIGSDIDFATGYMKHVLGFVGIHDVSVIEAGQLMSGEDEKIAAARERINALAA